MIRGIISEIYAIHVKHIYYFYACDNLLNLYDVNVRSFGDNVSLINTNFNTLSVMLLVALYQFFIRFISLYLPNILWF